MNYSELQKLYPDFKIPYEPEASYYIDLLLKNNPTLQKQYCDFLNLELGIEDIVKYKFKKFDEILDYFKTMNWDLNSIDNNSPLLNTKYPSKEFNNYRTDKY